MASFHAGGSAAVAAGPCSAAVLLGLHGDGGGAGRNMLVYGGRRWCVRAPPAGTCECVSVSLRLSSGKTALLFNRACDVALAGGDVMYLCRRERMERPPLQVIAQGQDAPRGLPDVALARIHLKCAARACSTI